MVSSHVSTSFSCYHKCILLQWQCEAIDVCPWNQLHDPPVPTLLISHSSQDHTTTESYSLYPLQTHKNLWYIGQEEQDHNSKDKHTQLKHSTTATNTPPHSSSIDADEPDRGLHSTATVTCLDTVRVPEPARVEWVKTNKPLLRSSEQRADPSIRSFLSHQEFSLNYFLIGVRCRHDLWGGKETETRAMKSKKKRRVDSGTRIT